MNDRDILNLPNGGKVYIAPAGTALNNPDAFKFLGHINDLAVNKHDPIRRPNQDYTRTITATIEEADPELLRLFYGTDGDDVAESINDAVNSPRHYNDHPFLQGECWDYLAHLGTFASHAFKYLWRYADKGNPDQDLQKALKYTARIEDGHRPYDEEAADQISEQIDANWADYLTLTAEQRAAVDALQYLAYPHATAVEATRFIELVIRAREEAQQDTPAATR